MFLSIHYTFITLISVCLCVSVCSLKQLLIGRLFLFEELIAQLHRQKELERK